MPRHQILIVEDDSAHRYFCQHLLEKEGFSVACGKTCEEAVGFLSQQVMDVVLLDLNLPDGDGLDLCKIVCLEYQVPVLMMTARDSPAQRFAGFEAGAADYLVKPFHPGELLFRLRSVLKKTASLHSGSVPGGDRPLVYGRWELDMEELLLRIGDASPIKLTAGEAGIMSLLLRAQGRTVSGVVLQQAVAKGWGGNSKSVGVLISRLRRQLGVKQGALGGIETVHGIGYRLTALESL